MPVIKPSHRKASSDLQPMRSAQFFGTCEVSQRYIVGGRHIDELSSTAVKTTDAKIKALLCAHVYKNLSCHQNKGETTQQYDPSGETAVRFWSIILVIKTMQIRRRNMGNHFRAALCDGNNDRPMTALVDGLTALLYCCEVVETTSAKRISSKATLIYIYYPEHSTKTLPPPRAASIFPS